MGSHSSIPWIPPPDLSEYDIPILVTACLSLAFLLPLFWVFLNRKEDKNTLGKNIISLCFTLTVGYILVVADKSLILHRQPASYGVCYIFSMVTHFIYIARTLWTNSIAYDILLIMKTSRKSDTKKKVTSRYNKYFTYVWLGTIAIWGPSVAIDYFQLLPEEYTTNYGKPDRFMNSDWGFRIFYMIPVLFIVFTNFLMFALSIRRMRKRKKLCNELEIKEQKNCLQIFMKLVLVLGVLRVSMFIGPMTSFYYMNSAVTCLDSLYGVYIFLIFVIKCPKRSCFEAPPSLPENGIPDTNVTSRL